LINEGLSLIAGKVKSFKCLKKSPPSGGFVQRFAYAMFATKAKCLCY